MKIHDIKIVDFFETSKEKGGTGKQWMEELAK